MTPLPDALHSEDQSNLVAWRIDDARFAPEWNSGEGAFRYGGRWNSKGTRAVYCSLDPSTALLEVAVHKGFVALDKCEHIITGVGIADASQGIVLLPNAIPDQGWLNPGIPSEAQQAFGDALLARHSFFVIPSAVSRLSWNLVMNPKHTRPNYRLFHQSRLVLDPRLNISQSHD